MSRLLVTLNDPVDYRLNRRALMLAAANKGWDVHIAAPDGPEAALITADGLPFHSLRLHPRGQRPDRELLAIADIARLYARLRPSVVHLRAVKLCLLGGLAARLAVRPALVSHFCGLGYLFADRGPIRAAFRHALAPAWRRALGSRRQMVVVQHQADGERLLAEGLVPASRLTVIPGSGVDTDRFRPTAPPAGPFTVIMPCRMLRSKGVATFAAASRLTAEHGIRLVLVGGEAADNPDAVPRQDLDGWLEQDGLAWWGEQHDMPAVYAQAHAVCLPSMYGEGIPKAILEAAACGLPIVAADAPWARASLRNEGDAVLVRGDDPVALANSLLRLSTDRALCLRLGRAARQRAEREFAESAVIGRFLSLYGQLEGEIASDCRPKSAE